ncbi:MAG: aminoacyl-tRNA hydrolase [Candidatus Carbobacillus altaicus]|uniref:Peptidyl-tRNA hydrolase n=1 Tax=Candidatus Carbonibacillus altaicus TaxID=2163959 RepID=A0A2R6Y1P0_9BACL|nr:aminoacyl-tRNA hydrolase [Candidatus Carbobacillus altaicus]PTQ56581.1 MAG: Peptidyl-tRNA hydrolase [Candidatus Carbobacillus altaicus]
MLIVGLGNPGLQYEKTRHNIGFMVLDALLKKADVLRRQEKFSAVFVEAALSGVRFLALYPQTYMNRSGEAVGQVMRWYHLDPEAIMVVYDDLDLPLGRLRLRKSGSHGGHNGMRSVLQVVGHENIKRLKIGIGRPPAGWAVADYVLSPFLPDEQPLVLEATERAVAAIQLALTVSFEQAMNRYN